MTRRLLALCAAIALAIPAAAHAQSKGQIQVGVGAGMPFYADTLGLDDPIGFGGRLGYMISDKIGLEVDAFYYSMQPTDPTYSGPDMTETPFHGRVTYNAPLGKSVAAIFGVGYTYNLWGGDSLESFYGLGTTDNDAGPGALVGLRFGGSGLFSLRVDVTGDYIVNPVQRDQHRQRQPLRPRHGRHAEPRVRREAQGAEGHATRTACRTRRRISARTPRWGPRWMPMAARGAMPTRTA